MDRFRYSASSRLGIWDSLQEKREEFIRDLHWVLNHYSSTELESSTIEFIPTDDIRLASIAAICDKIISRGIPTLSDPELERSILTEIPDSLLQHEELTNGSSLGFQLISSRLPVSPKQLIQASVDLLSLPYSSNSPFCHSRQPLAPEQSELTSEAEDIFLKKFEEFFGHHYRYYLHRQVLFRDLVGDVDGELLQSRVDFAFQIGAVNWIIEIDGIQHQEPGQMELDKRRDKLLQKHGWKILRVSTDVLHADLPNWLQQQVASASREEQATLNIHKQGSVAELVRNSSIHALALQTIIHPHAVHACLRGLSQLIYHQVLDTIKKQRILVIEEDLSVFQPALHILKKIWTNLNQIAPDTPPWPEMEVEIIHQSEQSSKFSGHEEWIRSVSTPSGNYDLIISFSALLNSGTYGSLEKKHFPDHLENRVAFRRAIGFRKEQSLQWSEPLQYDLADLESALNTKDGDPPVDLPKNKLSALKYFLNVIFRKRDFWDGQLRVISRLLQGKPTIVLLPTGGGKSLTYQFSGLLLPGMTIVIDPLVSLMYDQVENLHRYGIDFAECITGNMTPIKKDRVVKRMEKGELGFVFVSPERLQIKDFRDQLQTVVSQFPVSLAVVDEAHCISEWGHDFRPSYLHLPRNLQRHCSNDRSRIPTLVGLTGTASFAVLTDIQLEMQINSEDAIVLPRSFDRKELQFEVKSVPMSAKGSALKTLRMQLPRRLQTNPQTFFNIQGDRTNSGIIFCPHVNGSLGITEVAKAVGHRNFFGGSKPKSFSGDHTDWSNHKTRTQQEFKQNQIQELVATKSFGMGIDKPNIRYTIHFTVPQSVEAFYQEAGRAGRNGRANYALCSIIYSDDNWDAALDILNERDHQEAMARLQEVHWADRGDILVQLWLMLNSYKGREQEKTSTLQFWEKWFARAFSGNPKGSTKTQEIVYHRDSDREKYERAIFRLMLLGVLDDYTINWHKKAFSVVVRNATPEEIKQNLRLYLLQYKFEDFVDDAVAKMNEQSLTQALESAISIMVDFVYDEIVAKRKQALRTMGELCRNFRSDQDFRDAILSYLQESEFSDQLRQWVNQSFDSIGIESIHELMEKVTTQDELKRLIGTTRRMLDEDPQNISLRYLSLCARAQSATEPDESILQETVTLVKQILNKDNYIAGPESLLVHLLEDVESRRPKISEEISHLVFRNAGNAQFARLMLTSGLSDIPRYKELAVTFVVSGAVQAVRSIPFYLELMKENQHESNKQNP